jgi:hypothetical protein
MRAIFGCKFKLQQTSLVTNAAQCAVVKRRKDKEVEPMWPLESPDECEEGETDSGEPEPFSGTHLVLQLE